MVFKREKVVHTYAGYIAIIGRPNVGKSTLLNAILGKKLSITSRKPQTTRHRILGIKTIENNQFIYVDTPGIHADQQKKLLNKFLNRTALSVLKEVDVVIWVIEPKGFVAEDEKILEKIKKIQKPLLIIINKIDLLAKQENILPLLDQLSKQIPEAELIPLSAQKKLNIKTLEKMIGQYLPESPFYFNESDMTDRPNAFIAAEMIREQLVRLLGQELPYATMVSIQKMEKKKNILHIHAVIWVEKENQKKIVIGEAGQKLKMIGQKSRLSMENYFGNKIFLQTWVKVKSGWSENERILKETLM